ncbi:MAG: CoA pyrophosphatase [Burkholderiaceae bacterium]
MQPVRGIVDPTLWPIVAARDSLPAVDPHRLSVPALRQRFADAHDWQPELFGDAVRAREAGLRDAAVLVPIVMHESGSTVLLTERTATLSSHAGQVAFPGGRRDPEDPSAIWTALREAEEEVGLSREFVEVIGHLPDYLTGTGYRVTPVVALVRPQFTLTLQTFEVAEAFEVPLSFLMDPAHHQLRRMTHLGAERTFYAMPYRPTAVGREYFIWGATAAMLRNLYRFLSA